MLFQSWKITCLMVMSVVDLFVWRVYAPTTVDVKLLWLQTKRFLSLCFQVHLDTSQQYLILNLVILLSGNELIRIFKTFLLKVG